MGLLDTLLGRSKPKPAQLDALFAYPSAAITLEVATGFKPNGVGSVCVKPAEGGAFAGLRQEMDQLLALDGGKYEETRDSYGFVWLVRRGDPADPAGLITDLHAANSTLTEAGFGSALLCTVVAMSDGTRPLGLIYLYKRGTWYPFAPAGPDRRDSALELEVRSAVGSDLRIEEDLSRWFPVYGAPGLG
jgi:hypothetical protein